MVNLGGRAAAVFLMASVIGFVVVRPGGIHRQSQLRARPDDGGHRSGGPLLCPLVAGRPGALSGGGGAGIAMERSTLAVMAWLETQLERLLAIDYLDGLPERSLEDVRAMRAECQEAETSVSYLRRMAQGRLDLVHACFDHHDEGGDLDSLVERLPSIIGSGPARPQGYGRLPSQMSPDLDREDLTEELDAVLDADH